MPHQTKKNSRSLRRQADTLELKLACRQRKLWFRIDRIKQAMVARLASPTMLLVAFGSGVVLEQTSHRRKDTLAYLLNAGYAGIRLLESLSYAVWAFHRKHQESSKGHVQPV
jgi:hypothetical protein